MNAGAASQLRTLLKSEAKLTYSRLNIQTPCPPRGQHEPGYYCEVVQVRRRGRAVKTIFADNSFITNIFNLLGQQIGKMDQATVLVSNVFDVSGQLTSVVMPSVPDPENGNNPTNPAWTYAFDQYGRQIATVDAKGRSTTNVFDQFGRPAATRLPMTQTNWTKYNAWAKCLNSMTSRASGSFCGMTGWAGR